MRRWLGLLGLFLLAAIGTVIVAARLQPGELERRHAVIQVGMTEEEVEAIMGERGTEEEPLSISWFPYAKRTRWTWYWSPPKRIGASDYPLSVTFNSGRVVTTRANGEQLRP